MSKTWLIYSILIHDIGEIMLVRSREQEVIGNLDDLVRPMSCRGQEVKIKVREYATTAKALVAQ